MTKPYDDSNWREEYKGYTSSRYELDLLENGPKSLSQSWMMGALHNKWKKMKGYKDPEPPDVSSSLGEFFKKQIEVKYTFNALSVIRYAILLLGSTSRSKRTRIRTVTTSWTRRFFLCIIGLSKQITYV